MRWSSPPNLLLTSTAQGHSLAPPPLLHHLPPPLSLPCFSRLSSPRGKYLLGEGEAGRSPDLHDGLFRLQGEGEGVEDNVMGWCECHKRERCVKKIREVKRRSKENWKCLFLSTKSPSLPCCHLPQLLQVCGSFNSHLSLYLSYLRT